jgi:hypothetical protein
MFPWLFFWAPQYHFPWSGAVKQDIAPDTSAFFGAIAPSAGDGPIEKAVFERASYGKQIGILSDVVLSLVDDQSVTPAQVKLAVEQLKQLAHEVMEIKAQYKQHRIDTAIRILETLERTDPDAVERIVARFRTS